ncbi:MULTISPECIES: hypothetical protein [Azospirillum]|uniref:Uncharacterized protein n=1 Tax=Azospirillum brasilense TaxID=192 RepID=A0ABU4NXY8_AZOBR|nr:MULTISPECIES: hypothetical protein [Azospirillum]MDW7555354.1 hypothetical protein [Azospirillum brasilense]MDW7595238.1 hypothetical protein [Azospirillum brasilense]MDW7630392.1 hypothetical protein [Azospirillum brasilense]MDX5949759.1 hypothetical protein [Azospirillum brasilense]TVZ67376.1 hypothetical protein OH82_00516 [Azospirillum brasilense]
MIEMDVNDFWKMIGVACAFVSLSGIFGTVLGLHYGRKWGRLERWIDGGDR